MPCEAAELSNWDRLFTALEDSHMRQNMLLDSLAQCCGSMVSLRTQLDKLVKGKGLPGLEAVCRLHAEQAGVRLERGLLELREEEARREGALNATLQQLLRRSLEGCSSEESWGHGATPSGGAESGEAGGRPTQTPGALGATAGSGRMRASPLLKERDAASPPDAAAVVKALVAIATELQSVHLQLSRVIEQVGTPRKHRGDT